MAKKLTIVVDAEDLASGKVKALSATMIQSTAKVERQQTSAMTRISGAISKFQIATALAGGAAIAFAAKIGQSIIKVTAFQDKITKTARSLGVTTEFLSSMSFAAERSGTSFEAVNMGLRLLIKRANDANEGLKEATRSFDALGIEVTNQDGTLKKSEQLFLEAADSLSKMEDKTKRAALAQELFGRSGTQLLPLLESGREGIEELQKQAKKLGITFSTETGRKAEEFQDNLTNLKTSLSGVKMTLVNEVTPALTEMFGTMTDGITTVKSFVDSVGEILTFRIFGKEIKLVSTLKDVIQNMARGKSVGDAFKFAILESVAGVDILDKNLKKSANSATNLKNSIVITETSLKKNSDLIEQINSLEQQSNIIHNAIAQSIQDEKIDYSELEKLYNRSIPEIQIIAEKQKETATYAKFTYENLLQAGNALAQIIAMSRKGKLKFSSILRIGSMVASMIPGGQAVGAGLGVASNIIGSAGYQQGGSFIVPGKGDRDMPFIIPLTPGEKVDVTPRGGNTITNYQTSNNANINIGISANKIDESFMKNEFVPMLKRTLREYNITLQ